MIRELLALFPPRDHWSLAGVLLIGVLSGLAETLGLGLVLPYVSLLTDPDRFATQAYVQRILAWIGPISPDDLVLSLTAVLAFAYVAKGVVVTVARWVQTRFTFSLQVKLGGALIRRYLALDYTYHLSHNSAELIVSVNDEIRTLSRQIIAPLLAMVSETIVMVGIVGLLLVFSPGATLAAVAFFAMVVFLFQRVLRRRLRMHAHQRFQFVRGRLKSLTEALAAIKEIKILGRTEHFAELYDANNLTAAHAQHFHAFVAQLPRIINEILLVVAILLIVAIAKVNGVATSSFLPMISLFAVAAIRIVPAANTIMTSMSSVRFNRSALDSLHRDLAALNEGDTQARSPATGATQPLARFAREFAFVDVRYRYPGAVHDALNGVSFSIVAGSAVAIVGPSGSGKSTIIDLLVGLLRPTAGRILVDGSDIAADSAAWQRQIGYIPQRLYLTDDTIRRNIAFGLPDHAIDENRLRRSVELARLDEVIRRLPHGVDTPVGDLGGRLSGGQRQRIGIARAIYNDPTVLVMDEATAALDQVSEREIIDALSAFRGLRTTIMVAHRLASVRHCDRIFFVLDGRVVAAGTYDELLADRPEFRAFAQVAHG